MEAKNEARAPYATGKDARCTFQYRTKEAVIEAALGFANERMRGRAQGGDHKC